MKGLHILKRSNVVTWPQTNAPVSFFVRVLILQALRHVDQMRIFVAINQSIACDNPFRVLFPPSVSSFWARRAAAFSSLLARHSPPTHQAHAHALTHAHRRQTRRSLFVRARLSTGRCPPRVPNHPLDPSRVRNFLVSGNRDFRTIMAHGRAGAAITSRVLAFGCLPNLSLCLGCLVSLPGVKSNPFRDLPRIVTFSSESSDCEAEQQALGVINTDRSATWIWRRRREGKF